MKGTGPDRDRTAATPRPWFYYYNPIDTTWIIGHKHKPDNTTIVGIVADEGDAKMICDAVNLRAA